MRHKIKKSKFQSKALKPSMKKHVKALGLRHESAYLSWCAAHNFDTTLQKCNMSMEEELNAYKRGQHTLAEQARIHHNPDRFLHDICVGKSAVNTITRDSWREIAAVIAAAPSDSRYRNGLAEFLLEINKQTKFVFETTNLGGRPFRYIQALIHLYDRRDCWIRNLKEWRPRTHNADGQFRSLVTYLLERYRVPEFMVSSWFRADAPAKNYRDWFLLIASGKNIRTAQLPVKFTKKLAHNFLKAPSCCSVEQAITWAYVHALGGDAVLAEALLASRVGETLAEHKFWASVFGFFIDNPMLDRSHVAPIIDYIYAQKFEVRECVTAPGVVTHISPPQPNLSMNGRTPESLLKQAERWHGNLVKGSEAQKYFFKKSGIPEFSRKTGIDKQDCWRIRELLSGAQLIREGRDMKHCVASYARACAAGKCSIWTMEYESPGGVKKNQTIEVSQFKQVVQCRGRCNAYPTESELNILKSWAQTAGLSISPYIVSRG